MKKAKLTLMVGLPRSGKDTWINLNKTDEIVISNDWIRENIFQNHYSRSINPSIWMITDAALRILLSQGKDVILNGINLQKRVRKEYISTAKECGATTEIVFLNIPVEECLKRNEKTGQLPHEDLIHIASTLEFPEKDEADIVTEVLDSRKQNPPKNWYEYHHKDCGTRYRGCHPTECPKNQYENTGEWRKDWSHEK